MPLEMSLIFLAPNKGKERRERKRISHRYYTILNSLRGKKIERKRMSKEKEKEMRKKNKEQK